MDLMGKALGIVTRSIAAWLIRQAGFTQATARTGAVTFVRLASPASQSKFRVASA